MILFTARDRSLRAPDMELFYLLCLTLGRPAPLHLAIRNLSMIALSAMSSTKYQQWQR
jgi:hypothetical protein